MGKKRAKILEGDDEEKGKDGKKKKQGKNKIDDNKKQRNHFFLSLNANENKSTTVSKIVQPLVD